MQLPMDDSYRNKLAAILMESSADAEYTAGSVRVALAALRRPHIERALQQLQPQIDDAAKKGDTSKLTQLSAEKMKLKESEDMRAPLAFLLGKLNFDDDFKSFSHKSQDGGVMIVATPK